MLKIIGLGHYSRVGKDTFAKHIQNLCIDKGVNCQITSLAYKLKEIAFQLYGWAGMREPEFYETEEGALARNVPLTAMASEIFPDGPTPVEVWIAIGSPAIRDCVYPDTWIQEVIGNAPDGGVLVIPDVRFPNEFNTIRGKGGTLIKIERPDFLPRDSVADMALINETSWDYLVTNEGGMSELQPKAQEILTEIGVLDYVRQ